MHRTGKRRTKAYGENSANLGRPGIWPKNVAVLITTCLFNFDRVIVIANYGYVGIIHYF